MYYQGQGCRLGEQQVGMQLGDILKAGGGKAWRGRRQPRRWGSNSCYASKGAHRMETLVIEVDVGER